MNIHSSSEADWFVFIKRKTTSTVVILQVGSWAFSWLALCSTDFLFDPLRIWLWCATFVRESKNFFFSNWCIANLHIKIGERYVHGKQKRIGKISQRKNNLELILVVRTCCFYFESIIVFVLAILVGRVLCISFVWLSQFCVAYSASNGNNSRCHTWCRSTFFCAVATTS